MYKIIIAGSRNFADYSLLRKHCNIYIAEVQFTKFVGSDAIGIVTGAARGADRLGERYALEYNYHSIVMPAQWDEFGKSAGYVRNAEMAKISNGLIAFWDGKSRGTAHMIDLAKKNNLNIKIVLF
jgi:hypothetical protein